ncbi:beta-glucoside-specific PTS transporter subunit IIABC [Enterococcus sp. AZ194]|uniref:beta-glucoside-specific PTS transporter subunit IIABC n=1 Tax=Enterococcus sp. AZ194 TaxID=2774629 RepID=UPI003F687AFF
MRKYEELAAKIIKNVGGDENIESLTHCVTRLRFQLKDEKKANDAIIKNMDGVVTLMKSAGQYQVVIGNHVPDVYDEVLRQAQIKTSESTGNATKKKMSAGDIVIDFISNVMGPILPVLMASGILKGLLAILQFAGWIDQDGGLYALFSGMGDALFYFFPVLLGHTTAKKLKMDPFVGLIIGAALMYPTLQNVDLNIVGIKMNVTYSSTVLPVILTTLLASVIYKFFNKVIPDVIKTFIVPMLTILIAVPIGFILIGPAANFVSDAIANGIMSVYDFSPILAGIILGGTWQILVIFGIHNALVAVAIVQMMSGQPTPIFALTTGASYAQLAVVFAIWLKTKNKKLKAIALPAWISAIFGVTEPAIYGVTLPRIKYFVISCIGAALGGAYIGFSGILVYQMAGMGIFGFPGFFGGEMAIPTILMHFFIAIAISMISSFVATYVLFKDDAIETDNETHSAQSEEMVSAPIKGKIIPLSEIKDEAFSLGVLGKGVAILPEEGKLYAPVSGVVTTLFPTLHAIGLTADNGLQILIHVGMDTVQLQGEGFTAHVKQDDHVNKGDLLLEFDIELIKARGFSVETPVVITNSNDLKKIEPTNSSEVEVADNLLATEF